MDFEQHVMDKLDALVASSAASTQAIHDLTKRFDTVIPILSAKIDAKADSDDFDKISDKVSSLERKTSWIMGVGSTIAFLLSSVLVYFDIHAR